MKVEITINDANVEPALTLSEGMDGDTVCIHISDGSDAEVRIELLKLALKKLTAK